MLFTHDVTKFHDTLPNNIAGKQGENRIYRPRPRSFLIESERSKHPRIDDRSLGNKGHFTR